MFSLNGYRRAQSFSCTERSVHGETGRLKPVFISACSHTQPFKKDEQTGHCTRAAYQLCSGSTDDAFTNTTVCHLLDFISRQQRKVVRAAFSAELIGACDAVDKGILFSQMLHEINTGDCTIESARTQRDNGGYSMPMVIHIDAMSVCCSHSIVHQHSS